MLEAVLFIYTFYWLVKFYVSVMQIGFVSQEKQGEAVLMSPEAYVQAGEYAVAKERLVLIELIVEYLLFLVWIGWGLTFLDGVLGAWLGENPLLLSTVFVLSFLLIIQLVGMPLDIYRSFVLDKKFGFSNMTPGLFVMDLLKGTGLTLILGGVVIYAISWMIASFETWWVMGFVFIFTLVVLINAIYPTIIAPMFNQFKPLDDQELNSKIKQLLDKVGFKSNGVFVVDASKRDSRLNAYFGGMGSSKKVVLFDTLLEKITHDELLSVLGHELGHFKHHDILKRIAMMGILFFGMFAIFGNLPHELFTDMGLVQNPHIVIVLFLLLSAPLSFLFMPILSYISRQAEYGADAFGAELGSKKDLVNALLKLSGENKSFPKAHPLYIFFYFSHPPLAERLKELGEMEPHHS